MDINRRKNVLCETCGEETEYVESKRCDYCWNLEAGLRHLVGRDKRIAIKWLEESLKGVKEN